MNIAPTALDFARLGNQAFVIKLLAQELARREKKPPR